MNGGEKMQYEVYVRLTTSKYISVEADSKEEAEEIAKAEFIDEKITPTEDVQLVVHAKWVFVSQFHD